MNTCKNCAGEGIVGAGDFPTQKQGPLTTCNVCSGTGKSEVSETPMEEETTPEVVEETVVEAPVEDTAPEETTEATVE